MSSIRVPVLCAFGVGCLSSAALFGFWRADTPSGITERVNHADAQSSKRAQSVEVLTAPKVDRRAEVVDDSARIVARAEPARVDPVERDGDAKSEPTPAKDAPDVANASPPPGGSAVSDVLMDLEAAYRQRLIAAARAEAAAREEASAALERTPPVPAEPPREVVKAVAPVVLPAVAPAPVAVAPTPAPVDPAPPVAPVVVAQNDTRSVDVHIGDVNRNTYVTNVRQGDVYVIQQQLAMLNYMQLAGAAANPYAVQPPHVARGVVQDQPQQQQFRQFPSTLTNLDNPWGFNFAPPNLVH